MAKINASIDIRAPQERVWNIISDLDNEPKFWKGTKETRTISKHENTIQREITIAFRDQKCMQQIELEPKTKIKAQFTEGIISGTKTMTLSSESETTTLEVEWDIKLTGVMGIFTGMIKKHIKGGTEQAINSIRKEAES